jgi:hypothetical protein
MYVLSGAQSCVPIGVAAPMAPIDGVNAATFFAFVLDFNAVPAFILSPCGSVMHVIWRVSFKNCSAFYATEFFGFCLLTHLNPQSSECFLCKIVLVFDKPWGNAFLKSILGYFLFFE